MRDIIYIALLFAIFALLVFQFPGEVSSARAKIAPSPHFASFIVLSDEAYARCIDTTRTSWQIRSQSRVVPAIGSLDSGIPLLSEELPPINFAQPRLSAEIPSAIPIADRETYMFAMKSMGHDENVFAMPQREFQLPTKIEAHKTSTFNLKEMISTENSSTLKEIMK